jgi:hypothetical protein
MKEVSKDVAKLVAKYGGKDWRMAKSDEEVCASPSSDSNEEQGADASVSHRYRLLNSGKAERPLYGQPWLSFRVCVLLCFHPQILSDSVS